MVGPVVFQPTLLDCWACRDFKRFRQVLKGGGAIVVHPVPREREQAVIHGQATSNGGGEGGTLSSSHPRSPGYSWGSAGNALTNGPCPPSEVNRRDHLGRTVLHLLAASLEPSSIDYLTVLLAHPNVNVNLQDHENGWTALHRALYCGNLQTALALLKRSPSADVRIKDYEGLTAFDLYNSTVHGTNPSHGLEQHGELFTWGANRNATLGLGTSDDRAFPDRRTLRREDVFERAGLVPSEEQAASKAARAGAREPGAKYDRVSIRDVGMTKFATVVLTSERHNNVWVCGIGTNGRIGRAPQTQAFLEPLRDFPDTARHISVGPDHTCIVTTDGDVYTFGFNRFQQLGYTVEHGFGTVSSTTKGNGGAASTTFGGAAIPTADLDVQISPRKVLGALKKEVILGAAAGKLHSAAFTADALYTWGTNTGQLGYDRAATPIQIAPRKVTAITTTMTIVSVAVSDFATACLTALGDVLLLHNDSSFFVRFPQMTVGSQASVYRPRQARPKPAIQALVGGPNNSFAAISDIGEVWQFTAGHPSEYAQPSGTSTAAKASIRPQLIWSVRKNKKVGAAHDVAMGTGSDMILTTESGHVFVRQKKNEIATSASHASSHAISASSAPSSSSTVVQSVKGKSGWKPVPFLQRVIKVAINESGGLAAIKVDAPLRKIRVRGRNLDEDLRDALPHLRAHLVDHEAGKEGERIVGDLAEAAASDTETSLLSSDEDNSETDKTGQRHIRTAQTLAEAARRWLSDEEHSRLSTDKMPPLGCDMFVFAGGRYLPVHRSLMSARLPVLAPFLRQPPGKGNSKNVPAGISIRQEGAFVIMTLPSSSFGAALLLVHYLYTDDVPAIWTASVGMRVEKAFSRVKINSATVQTQLRSLAEHLQLPELVSVLSSTVPRVPRPTLYSSMQAFFDSHVATPPEQSPFHDVLLHMADRDVPAHSVVLRRSPFFSAFFQPQWTSSRWVDGVIEVNMVHVRWEVAQLVLLHLYTDKLFDVFQSCDGDRSADQYIDFVVEVLAFSNELLLDKMKLACCSLLRQRVIPGNVAAMLTDADFYNAPVFKSTVMDYAACTMETLLESGMLDDLETRIIKDLTKHVRGLQDARLKRTRAEEYLSSLIIKHQDYYFDLDVPAPSLGIAAARVPKRQARQSEQSPPLRPQGSATPSSARWQKHRGTITSAIQSPDLRPTGSSTPSAPTQLASRGDDSMMFSMDDLNDGGRSPQGNDATELNGVEDVAELTLPPPSAMSPTAATPWKSRTAEAGKVAEFKPDSRNASNAASPAIAAVDLRSIMAAERTRGQSHALPGSTSAGLSAVKPAVSSAAGVATPPPSSVRVSQKDRKKQQMAALVTPGLAVAPTSAAPAAQNVPKPQGGSPWKPVDLGARASPLAPTTPLKSSQLASLPSLPSASAARVSQSNAATPQPMGSTITPQRMRSAAQSRVSSGAGRDSSASQAWNSSTVFGSSPAGPSGGAAWHAASSPPLGSPALHAIGSSLPRETGDGLRHDHGAGPSLPTSKPLKQSMASDHSAMTLPRKSFAEIQAEELRRYEEMMSLQQARAPRSFAELQEEDKLENERRRAEEQRARQFERDFEEESKRVQAEQRKKAAKARKGTGNKKKGAAPKQDSSVKAATDPGTGQQDSLNRPAGSQKNPARSGTVRKNAKDVGGHPERANASNAQDGTDKGGAPPKSGSTNEKARSSSRKHGAPANESTPGHQSTAQSTPSEAK